MDKQKIEEVIDLFPEKHRRERRVINIARLIVEDGLNYPQIIAKMWEQNDTTEWHEDFKEEFQNEPEFKRFVENEKKCCTRCAIEMLMDGAINRRKGNRVPYSKGDEKTPNFSEKFLEKHKDTPEYKAFEKWAKEKNVMDAAESLIDYAVTLRKHGESKDKMFVIHALADGSPLAMLVSMMSSILGKDFEKFMERDSK